MGEYVDVAKFVANPEVVTSAFGSWPSLHDAEILAVTLERDNERSLERDNDPTLTLTVKVLPYDPDGKATKGVVTFVFEGVSDVSLGNFNHQNVINALLVEETEEGKKLFIEQIYGLGGEAIFGTVRVLSAETFET